MLTDLPQAEFNTKWVGQAQYGAFKSGVADIVADFLSTFQQRYAAINEAYVHEVLQLGEKRAEEQALTTLQAVKKAVGLRS